MDIGVILALIFRLAIPTVLTVEKVVGEAKSGADKKTLAETALAGATQAALSVLGGDNAAYAEAASQAAGEAIDAAVAITKVTGQYQTATQQASAAQGGLPATPSA